MSIFRYLFPTPSFAEYTGPYAVGTREIEVPTSELSTPAPDPSISTVSYRIFYPCSSDSKTNGKYVRWLPEPQTQYFAAYARFMQASPWLAGLLSYFPLLRLLFHTTIPASPSAPLLAPTDRWPVAIFSHGLGGSKNAYSAICGSLASHGLVVVALDHRDGSSPISFIRASAGTFKDAKRVDFRSLGHAGGVEVDGQRDEQLRIRCWEMGAAWQTMGMIDRGENITNLAEGAVAATSPLEDFRQRLDIHSPGRVSWIGHSYGAATVAQFVKSVAYYEGSGVDTLLAHPPSQALRQQITSSSPTVFLDLWAQPLKSVHTRPLFEKPLPCYSNDHARKHNSSNTTTTPTTTTSSNPEPSLPSAPLSILSESFFNWKSNLADTIRILSPHSDSSTKNPHPQPRLFYPLRSAHLSQSDFGPLFPLFTRRVFKAENPQRTIELNVRAILETLRRAGLAVGREKGEGERDEEILDGGEGKVGGWVAIPLSEPLPEEDEAVGKGGAVGRKVEAVEEDVRKEVIMQGDDEGYDSPGHNMNTLEGEAGAEVAVEG